VQCEDGNPVEENGAVQREDGNPVEENGAVQREDGNPVEENGAVVNVAGDVEEECSLPSTIPYEHALEEDVEEGCYEISELNEGELEIPEGSSIGGDNEDDGSEESAFEIPSSGRPFTDEERIEWGLGPPTPPPAHASMGYPPNEDIDFVKALIESVLLGHLSKVWTKLLLCPSTSGALMRFIYLFIEVLLT